MEKETKETKQKWYLGRPVTVVGETHPSKEVTIRHENGETESVQKRQVTDVSPADQSKIDQDKAVEADKAVKDKQSRDIKSGKVAPVTPVAKTPAPATDHPVKDWFKK
jgi:hypothetical protein